MARREWLNEVLKRLPPERLQGVTKERIRKTLRVIARESDDMVDAVFALLDNTTPTAFSRTGGGATFSDGASTAHVADHVGRFQRRASKLDREGRDYWIKPLRDVGAIEQVYLNPATGTFVAGHPGAKSPNSAYRLAANFVQVLRWPQAISGERCGRGRTTELRPPRWADLRADQPGRTLQGRP